MVCPEHARPARLRCPGHASLHIPRSTLLHLWVAPKAPDAAVAAGRLRQVAAQKATSQHDMLDAHMLGVVVEVWSAILTDCKCSSLAEQMAQSCPTTMHML